MALKNQVWIGSIKDSYNVWHPVVASPDEDYCHRFCQRVGGDCIPEDEGGDSFYTDTYTVELVPIVLPDATLDEDEWVTFEAWEEIEGDDANLYEQID